MKNLLISVFCLFICGCSIFPDPPYVPVHYFDIGQPPVLKHKLNLRIKNIGSVGPYFEKMVFRTSDNSLKFDEFNRWSELPNRMVRRYFILAFEPVGPTTSISKAKKFILNAEILKFDCDLKNKKADLAIKVLITDSKTSKMVFYQVFNKNIPVASEKAEDYAQSMGQALSGVIEEIALAMKKIR